MPVYTVHAPFPGGADLRATDKFVFVRDGFHFWAMIFGPFWLLWNRLWLALIGWVLFHGRVQRGAVQPRCRTQLGRLCQSHHRAADGVRSLEPAPLDLVARQMAAARRGGRRQRRHRRAPLLRALEPEAARHRQRSMGHRSRRSAAHPQHAGSVVFEPAANSGRRHRWIVSRTGRSR